MSLLSLLSRPGHAVALLACFTAATAFAQVPDPAQTAERVQREEQDRQREQFRRARESARPATVTALPAENKSAVPAAGTVKRQIRELNLVGADHLKPAFRARLLTEYTGELGLADVERLLNDLTRHYVMRGYVTTRAYLPAQDLTGGVLKIVVVEGRLETITGPAATPNIFPAARYGLLNLRHLEQGIDNLNRIASNNAALDLQPGAQPGDTRVAIQNTPGPRWHASFSADNTGSRDTGREQLSGTFTFDNALGLADALTLNHRRAADYQPNVTASESTSLNYTVPWGWQLFTVGANNSSYALTYFAPSGFNLPFDGGSRSVFTRLDRLLWRNQSTRLNASATLTWRDSKNYLLGSLIGVSSRTTSTFDAALDGSTVWRGGTLFASLGGGAGLGWFGTLRDASGRPDYAPRAQFVKAVASAGYTRPFTAGGMNFTFGTALNLQLTRDVLYGSDQLTVGGLYAVRGFDKTNLAGDVGLIWRNDLSLNLAPIPGPFGGRFGGKLTARPYAGLDQGTAWTRATSLPVAFRPQEGSLTGGALGAAFALGRASLDLSWHQSLARPAGMIREGGRFYARAGFSL